MSRSVDSHPLLGMGARRLTLIAAGLPALEAVAVAALGWHSGLALTPQLTGLGPFGVFHDLRWLLIAHHSAATLLVGLVALVGLRAFVTLELVRAAWPDGSAPSRRTLAPSIVGAILIMLVLLAPAASLLFGVEIIPVSWPVLAALPAAALVIGLTAHGALGSRWWQSLPPPLVLRWTAVSAVAFSAGGLLLTRLPTVTAPIVAGAVGLVNAHAWKGSVTALSGSVPPRRRIATVPVAITGSIVLVLASVAVGFAVFDVESSPSPPGPGVTSADTRAVLLVGGFNSSCCGEAADFQRLRHGVSFESFSYSGLDENGRPQPHDGEATGHDLFALGERMARQIEALHSTTGAAVDVVAESEGTLVVAAYLAATEAAPVNRIMLLSPIGLSNLVSFPPRGESGAGYGAGYLLRMLGNITERVSPFEADPDGALARSILRLADEEEDPLLGIDVMAIFPLADALSGPVPSRARFSTVVVPAFHGGLRGRSDVREMIGEWLDGGRPAGSAGWRLVAGVLSDGLAAWRSPAFG